MKNAVVIGAEGQLGPLWVDLLEKDFYTVETFGPPNRDVRDLDDVDAFVRENPEADLLVYNAAIDNPPGSAVGGEADILAVNLIGAATMITYFYETLKKNAPSNIVLIGSMLGFTAPDPRNYAEGWDKPWAYGASKAGLWQLCRHFAVRWAADRVTVNMLALSGVDTPKLNPEFKAKYTSKIPIGRMLTPADFSREFLTACRATVPYDFPLFVGGGWTLW